MISTSPKLGLIVLIASPLLVALSFFLLRPLHHAQEVERKRSSELTSRVTDIVAGLRIQRGIGGEDTDCGLGSGRSDQRDSGEVRPVTLGVASEEPVSGHGSVRADVEIWHRT
jgi:ABC-type multidrug transport system fused ATPase/permease subunit